MVKTASAIPAVVAATVRSRCSGGVFAYFRIIFACAYPDEDLHFAGIVRDCFVYEIFCDVVMAHRLATYFVCHFYHVES